MTRRIFLIAKVFLYAYSMSAVTTIMIAIAAYLIMGKEIADHVIFNTNVHLYLIPLMTAIHVRLFKWRETTKLDHFALLMLASTALVTFVVFAISFVGSAILAS